MTKYLAILIVISKLNLCNFSSNSSEMDITLYYFKTSTGIYLLIIRALKYSAILIIISRLDLCNFSSNSSEK